ncbi:MAG: zf-HC2 domain-containing protein [Caulobacteraceae bacterium]|nr:zf-HC2 domain-containing protein [Caulobacteraceae bacterium]
MALWTPSRRADHRHTRRLLPWYLTGQLDPDEAQRVRAHLDVCGACQSELAAERRLQEAVLSAPLSEPTAQPVRRGRGRILAGAIGAVGAIAASVAVAVVSLQPARAPVRHETYRTLGDPAQPRTGELVVVFDPGCSAEQMRSALALAHARIVDGPTATGAYVLRVPPGGRAAALAALHGAPGVRLAASLGGQG